MRAAWRYVKRSYITTPVFRALKGAMPSISETEREAIEAGTAGWDAELFSGRPDFSKLRRSSSDHTHRRGAGLSRRAH